VEKIKFKKESQKWCFAFFLSTPVLIYLFAHFFKHSDGIIPTGFLQYDNVSYAGNAQQLLSSKSTFLYANRLNDSDHYPHIYFQPQHLLLAALMKAGVSPGIALCLFTYIFSLIFFRVLLLVFDHLYPRSGHKKILMALFSWGGGLLALSGWFLFLIHQSPSRDIFSSSLVLDPATGWWGLNLGRSLFFSMEAFYHVLFFTAIFCILKSKWIWTVLIAFLLSLSHPFTGMEFLLIVLFWVFIEKVCCKNASIPWNFLFAMLALSIFHVWLYLIHLNQFPEHNIVFQQYQLNWKLRFYNMLPAYCITATFAILTAWRTRSIRSYISSVNTRLFLCWAAVALILANHELFIKGIQPLHFTRGYIWAPLFLLGIPAIEFSITDLLKNTWKRIVLAVGVILFLSDNINWIYLNTRNNILSESSVSFITPQQKEILNFLSKTTTTNTLIVGSDRIIPYLSTVYSPAYSWISHIYNTPFYADKLNLYNVYIQNGIVPQQWSGRDLLFLADKNNAGEMNRYNEYKPSANKVYESSNYLLYKLSVSGSK
jgi:hypothetical protein